MIESGMTRQGSHRVPSPHDAFGQTKQNKHAYTHTHTDTVGTGIVISWRNCSAASENVARKLKLCACLTASRVCVCVCVCPSVCQCVCLFPMRFCFNFLSIGHRQAEYRTRASTISCINSFRVCLSVCLSVCVSVCYLCVYVCVRVCASWLTEIRVRYFLPPHLFVLTIPFPPLSH